MTDNLLKKIRLILGYNQQEMADCLKTNLHTYRGYEYQKRELPSDVLKIMADTLRININWFLTGEGDMFISNCLNSLQKQDNKKLLENSETFYKRFLQLQAQNELSDFQLAKLTGISESRIEKLGIGKIQPSLDDLTAIKKHFDVSIDWLLYGETCQQKDNQETLSADEINILKRMAQKFNV